MKIFQFYKALDQWEQDLDPPNQWESSTLPRCNTNGSADGLDNRIDTGVDLGVSLELVPVGGNNPGEGVAADHKGIRVLEPIEVTQFPCPSPEDRMELHEVLVIAWIFDVGNKEAGKWRRCDLIY